MSKEIEAQVLFIDYDEIIKKLDKLNAKIKFDWTKFRIATFFPCLPIEKQNELYNVIFTRVRDEGKGNITITTKTKRKTATEGKFVNEYEISTPNTFEECKELLLANHLTMKSSQERLRQKWIIPNRPDIKEIVFDIWPGLPMHMEVEADSELNLMKFLSELDIKKDNIRYTNVSAIYEEVLGIKAEIINNNTPVINFATIQNLSNVNDKDKFNQILSQQKSYLKRFGFDDLLNEKKQSRIKSDKKHSKKNSKKSDKKHSKKSGKK